MSGIRSNEHVTFGDITQQSTSATVTEKASRVDLLCPGAGTVACTITGATFAGVTLTPEGSNDGWATQFALKFADPTGASAPVATVTPTQNTPVTYLIAKAGYREVRVRASAYSSGTCSVRLTAMPGNEGQLVAQAASAGAGLAATVTDGTKTASTTAQQLTASNIPATQGVWVSNMDASITIYVGASTVVTGGTRGVPLGAGQRDLFPVANANLLYVVAASGTPVVGYLVT